MKQTNFTKTVVSIIEEYFKNLDEELIFSNELHLQMHLAQHLVGQGYRLLYEYHIPSEKLKNVDKKDKDGKFVNYPWRTNGKPQEMYLDLVVTDKYESEYVPIEIKYKTRRLTTNKIFNKKTEEEIELLRNQGAHNIGMYNFWKDVHRLEMVRDTYCDFGVKSGIAIFVTNDPHYFKPEEKEKDDVIRFLFRMTEGRKTSKGVLEWKERGKGYDIGDNVIKTYPKFELEGCYKIEWQDIRQVHNPLQHRDFRYCMVVVENR